jgi:hypothetical protein
MCTIKFHAKETRDIMLNVALDGIRRRIHSAAALPLGDEPLCAPDKKLDGSQSQLERGDGEEFLYLYQESKSCCLDHSQVAILI